MKNQPILLLLSALLTCTTCHTTWAQVETFNYKRALSYSRTLSPAITSINRNTGEVVFGGGDSRGPTTPGLYFTWLWGDGTSNNGFFPQTKRYADASKNYVARVVANYSATDKDTAEVLVDFVPGNVVPVPLDAKLKVYIPNQPFAVDGVTRIPFTDRIFDPTARAQLEYLFQVCSSIEYDFVSGDVRMADGKFEQYMFRDSLFPGAYALSGSRPIAFGVGDVLAKGTVDYSSMCHEMGHNYTLNTPATYSVNGRLGNRASSFYMEAIAQIFQQAAGYELINNYQKYGIDEALLQKLKANFMVNARYQRATFNEYVKDGMPFSSWSKVPGYSYTDSKEAFMTFIVVAYKFMETAEQQGKGYRMPMKRMMQFLQRFNADWVARYDPQNDNAKAGAFRATLWAAAMSQAFQRDMRPDFRAINFPVSDSDWAYLSQFEQLPGVAESGRLLSVGFQKSSNPTLTADVSLTLTPGTTTLLTLPTGASLTAIKASFVTSCSATVSVGSVMQTSGVSVNDFSKPVVYVVSNGNATPTSYTLEVSTQVSLTTVENAVNAFMTKYNVPGMSVAITKDERLVYAKGYGLADKDRGAPVGTNSLFRIASVSKPITAIALLRLVDQGKLSLDQKVFGPGGILGTTYGSKPYTPQTELITVRHLLSHTAGADAWNHLWNYPTRIDPFYQPEWLKFTQAEVIGATLDTRPVTETPGTKMIYSNVGFNIAGRVLETVTGLPYERYVQDSLLKPLGITPASMRIGGSTLADGAPNEVVYYNPYAGYDQPYDFPHARLDAHGGWTTTAVNLARLMVAVDGGSGKKDILSAGLQKQMITAQSYGPPTSLTLGWQGLGWQAQNGAFWHAGGMAGTASYWLKIGSYTFAILINTRSGEASYYADIDKLCYQMSENLTASTFMRGDQFDLFFNAPTASTLTAACSLTATLTASSITFCQGQSATLTAAAGGGQCAPTFAWQRDGLALGGLSSPVVSVTVGGVYSVIAAENNGCPGTSLSLIISQKPMPDALIVGVSVSVSGVVSLSAAPEGTGLLHQWSLNGTALSGATSATVAVQQSGAYHVTITNNGCAGVSLPLTMSVPKTPGGRAAAEPEREKAFLTVSPNPSAGQITIRLHLPKPASALLSVTDLSGRRLLEWSLSAPQTDHQQLADLHGLPTGTYLIVAEANGQRYVQRVVRE